MRGALTAVHVIGPIVEHRRLTYSVACHARRQRFAHAR
jgi:hypothetical protein